MQKTSCNLRTQMHKEWAVCFFIGTACCKLPTLFGDDVTTMQALFGHLTLDVIILTVLYSLAGLGIAIVNDFKSIEGDRYAVHVYAVQLTASSALAGLENI